MFSDPMKVSHRVVGGQHYRMPIWPVVGFCVSWGQKLVLLLQFKQEILAFSL